MQCGFQADVLSRGYGREGRLACRVDPAGTAEQFGDEPLLLAREAGVPVYVARQRYEAGLLAEAELAANSTPGGSTKPVVHLLDDGFQHRQLARDVDILLLNRQDWRDSLLPAGNLREPLSAVRRADIVAIPDEDPELEAELHGWGWKETIWRLHRQMEIPKTEGAVLAFCGIARPEQFFAGLDAGEVRVAARRAFPDHHRYSIQDVQSLIAASRASGAKALLTTEKDLVRLGRLCAHFADNIPLQSVGLRVVIEQESDHIGALLSRIKAIPK